MRIIARIAVFLLFTPGFWFVNAAMAETLEDQVRWSYISSPDTPDGLSFGAYVKTVGELMSRSRKEAVDYAIFSLELADSTDGRANAESVVDIFNQANSDIVSDTLMLDIATYCPGGTEVRTNDQIFDLMDRQDDEYTRIAENVYERTRAQLDHVMLGKLEMIVVKTKSSLNIVAYDHKEAWEASNPNPDMRAILTDICSGLLEKADSQK